jgi:uncharacterized membrane protein YciS (DUF1049 family)
MHSESILHFSAPIITDDNLHIEGIPGTIKPLQCFQYNISIENASALDNGSATIYYEDNDMPPGVTEEHLMVFKWDHIAESWVAIDLVVNVDENSVIFTIDPEGLYLFAGRVSNADLDIETLIIILSSAGITLAIVIGASFKIQVKKKALRRIIPREQARLRVDLEPNIIDLEEGTGVEEEKLGLIHRESCAPRCTLHKGPVTEEIHVCSHCGAIYCKNCADQLVYLESTCWSCGHHVDFSGRKTISKLSPIS